MKIAGWTQVPGLGWVSNEVLRYYDKPGLSPDVWLPLNDEQLKAYKFVRLNNHIYSIANLTPYIQQIDTPTPRYTTNTKKKPLTDLLSVATDIEIAVFNYLATQGEVFEFQTQLLGGMGNEKGDAKVDFTLPEKMLALRVQGGYWHTGVEVEAKDVLQKARLSNMGWTVIDLWQNDLELSFNTTMKLAMQGQEMP
jgi:very-short-patch-repair endonuclease